MPSAEPFCGSGALLADPKDAAKELRAVLPPALASHIDFASLAPLPGTFVDEVLRDAHADLLFTVRYAEQETLLYVLLEHKSEVDRWTLLQLLRYMLRIWEKYLAEKPATKTLPPIIPIIINHSETGWTAPTHFQALMASPNGRRALLSALQLSFQVSVEAWPEGAL